MHLLTRDLGSMMQNGYSEDASVTIRDEFWDGRIAVNQRVTIPWMYKRLKDSGRWDSLKQTWKPEHGEATKPHMDWDSDVGKFVESACCALVHMAPKSSEYVKLRTWVEQAIDMIEAAQGEDGYINTYHTVVEPAGRWKNVAHNIELYDAGHLLEAAVAHYQATKSDRFLNIMKRYMDYVCTIFGPEQGKIHGYPGHQEIELALLRLYRICPAERYLALAKYFIEQRGHGGGEFFDKEAVARGQDPHSWIPPPPPGVDIPYFPEPRAYWYMQADQQIRETEKLRGHSVRAMYYLSAVQDLANISGDSTLHEAVNRLFDNMVHKNMYIHGGIGAIHEWEGFGEDFELPLNCYAETCASIGIMFLGKRMLEARLDGKVSQVMERALYNNILGGVSLDGSSFLYDQPLSTDNLHRHHWFEVCCCPPNLSRFLNTLGEYVFTASDAEVALNLYIGSHYRSDDVEINVTTSYPWAGRLEVSVRSQKKVGIAIREPCEKYTCSDPSGKVIDGYIHFAAQHWDSTIQVDLLMEPKITMPHHKVQSTVGRVALERGPLLYCLESPDCPGDLDNVAISRNESFEEQKCTIGDMDVVALRSGDLQFVPYFASGNRVTAGQGKGLRVWIKCNDLKLN